MFGSLNREGLDKSENDAEGARGTAEAIFKATGATDFSLHIYGKNPTKIAAEDYMKFLNMALEHDIMWTMAVHESSSLHGANLRQFNEEVYLSQSWKYLDGTPSFGEPDGWGVMQLNHNFNTSSICDSNNRQNPNPVPTSVVWSWKRNVLAANVLMNSKKQAANNHWKKLKDYWSVQDATNWSKLGTAFQYDSGGTWSFVQNTNGHVYRILKEMRDDNRL